jgi:hypothetical protein
MGVRGYMWESSAALRTALRGYEPLVALTIQCVLVCVIVALLLFAFVAVQRTPTVRSMAILQLLV